MTMNCRVFVLGLCVVGLATAFGCQPSGIPGLVPVSGKVVSDGQGVAGVWIMFVPQTGASGSRCASAVSAADGSFTAKTDVPGDGALPGDYSVTAVKQKLVYQGKDVAPGEEAPPGADVVDVLLEKYQIPETSGLTVQVPPKGVKDLVLVVEMK